jgi:DNA-binding response OmpR family regulator
LKNDIKYEDIVVIILLSSSSDRERLMADSCGSNGYLTTPVDLNELMSILKTVDSKSE